jgi:hypothetical protein
VKKATEELKINMLQWSGNSTDLKPIENSWSTAKAMLGKMDCSNHRMVNF